MLIEIINTGGLSAVISAAGVQGAAGVGVPIGGTTRQFLGKASSADFDDAWYSLVSSDITNFTESSQDAIGGILTDTSTVNLTYNDSTPSISADVIDNSSIQKVEIAKNSGAVVGTRKQLNFIEGTNVNLTVADDSINDQIDVTISVTSAVPDGDKGDITVSASGATWTIDNSVVTLAKMADISTDSFLGRDTAGTGVVEVLSVATAKTLLELSGTNTGDQTITLTGDVTGSGTGSFAATIANDAVTYAKMQDVSATDKLLGRSTAGAGNVEEIACTAFGRSLIDDVTASNARATLGLSNYETINSTGVITGGVLSIGTPNTTFSISDGSGVVVDNTSGSPTITPVTWSGKTNIAATYVATNLVSYVAINSSGTVIQSAAPFTNAEHRDYINLGSLVHVNLINLDAVNNFQEVAINPTNQLTDLSDSLGIFNIGGNVFSANGANMTINKSSGDLYSTGCNWGVDKKNPNVRTLASLTGLTFQYRFSTGTNGATGTSINPAIYDVGGVSTAVPANKFTIQRIYSFVSNNVKIQPGQAYYNSLAEAKAAIQTEAFVTEPSIAYNGLLRGFLIVRENATALNSATSAAFYEAGKFGSSTGVGGQSVSTMQNTYDNSVTPEILTDATRGALSIRRGSAADTDNVIEVLNNASSITFSVTGNGVVSAGVWSGTDVAVADGGTGASTAADARTNLGLVIGTDVQAYDAQLTDVAGLIPTDNGVIIGNGTNFVVESGATLKTSLGLTIGVDIQAHSSALDAVSGTNTGDQTITLTGDVTGSGTGSFAATIANDAVTYAKMQDVSATDKLLGRSTAGAGNVEEIACTAAGRDLLDDADASAQRTTLGLGTLATQSGTFSGTSSGTNTGDQTITLTGDVTGSGTGSFAATIANGAVTYAKMQDVSATDKLLGRSTAGAGVIEEIACTAFARTLLDDAAASNARTTLGVGTNDSPRFAAINLGNASDTTIARSGAGDITIEGNAVYRAGGTDVPVLDGGTGASSAADARTNLGLAIGTDIQAHSSALDAVSGTNTGDQNIFSAIAVSGQSNVVADSTSDTLTLVAGTNVTITTNPATGEITIAASGGGGGVAFTDITSGTNTTAAMIVGTGASLAATGTGTITATNCTGGLFGATPFKGGEFMKAAGSLAVGDNDIYTVPSGKYLFVTSANIHNVSGVSNTVYATAKVGGTYYRISSSVAVGAGGYTAPIQNRIFNAGDIISINCTATGSNCFISGILYEDTSSLKGIRKIGFVSGDNTVYTCPSGKAAQVIGSTVIDTDASRNIMFIPSAAITISTNLVPNGGSPSAGNKILSSTALSASVASSLPFQMTFAAGDFFNINSSITSATTTCWLKVIEMDA
jgi:hypothetical protein